MDASILKSKVLDFVDRRRRLLIGVGVALIGIIPALISLFFIAVILIGLLGLDAATVSNQ